MKSFLKKLLLGMGLLAVGLLLYFGVRTLINQRARAQAAAQPLVPLTNLDSVTHLEITPLYENAGDSRQYQVGHGVSYLVRADETTLLVDFGYNPDDSDPTPLRQNMRALGVDVDQLDVVFVSHPHPDHLGSTRWWLKNSFGIDREQVDLQNVSVYTPTHLSYPGVVPIVADQPAILARGVATTGVLLYPEVFPISLFSGNGTEQSLVVNVAGHGLVLITSCGHPGLERIVERAETAFGLPVVGVVGGLHYQNLTSEQLQPYIQFLQVRNPELVSLSPHDSSQAVLDVFRNAFAPVYREIEVGETIAYPEK